VTTAVSGDTLTVTGPDLSSYATGSSTTTFTNKTFDANGTGNSISNIETADIAAGTLVTASEGIGSNNNDTTIPTSAAVKAYADSVGGGGASTGDITFTGSTINSPSNADITMNPGGTGGVVFPAVTINDNKISSNRSNDNLNIEANGSGRVELGAPFADVDNATKYEYGVNTAFIDSSWDANTRILANNSGILATMTGTGGSNFEYGSENRTIIESNGNSATSDTRGVESKKYSMIIQNSDAATSTIKNVKGLRSVVELKTLTGDITATNSWGYLSNIIAEPSAGQTATFTNAINYYAAPVKDLGNGGTTTATNSYGFYHDTGSVATNTYAFYDASNSLSVFGDIQTQAVSITDNLITTNRSNDSLGIGSNGTGQVNISTTGTFDTNELTETKKAFGANRITNLRGVGILYKEDGIPEITADTDTRYIHSLISEWKLATGINTSNSNMRFRNYIGAASLDMNGSSSTNTSFSRGPRAGDFQTTVTNTNSTASTLGSMVGGNSGTYINGEGASGNTTVTNTVAMNAFLDISADSGITNTVTNAYGYRYGSDKFGSGGTETVTNQYGFYVNSLIGDNKYAFYDATNSLSVFGDIQTQAVSITDNLITTNRSNDDLNIEANGTGQVQIRANGGDFQNFSTATRYNNANIMYWEDLDHTIANDRAFKNNVITNIKLTAGQDTSNSNDRWRQQFRTTIDLNGSSTTPVSSTFSRGPMGIDSTAEIKNTNSGTTSRLGNASGNQAGVVVNASAGNISFEAGDSSSTNAGVAGNMTYVELLPGSGQTITIPTAINFYSTGLVVDGSGTASVTDSYAFYAKANNGSASITNEYAFYDAGNNLSRFGAVILANQAGDPSTVTDSAHIYAKDVASSSEVFVRDEAGNVTQISPHNEAGEWQYWSENIKTGKKVRVNMERMIRKLEEITGETFIENE